MIKFTLLLLSFASIFPISIEEESLLQKHQNLSYIKNLRSVGFIYSKKSENNYGLGTGCYIHPFVVLTAAHVVANTKETFFYSIITDGDSYRYKKFKARVVIHPKYVPSDTKYIKKESEPYDIALLFLEEGNFEVEIPSLSWNYSGGNNTYYIAGYGEWKKDTPTDYLENRRLAAVTNQAFYDLDANYLYVDFCNRHSFDLFGSSRPGDSGGPILTLCDNLPIIYGVTQSIITRNDEEEPYYGRYTSVAYNLDWILNTINSELQEL